MYDCIDIQCYVLAVDYVLSKIQNDTVVRSLGADINHSVVFLSVFGYTNGAIYKYNILRGSGIGCG